MLTDYFNSKIKQSSFSIAPKVLADLSISASNIEDEVLNELQSLRDSVK